VHVGGLLRQFPAFGLWVQKFRSRRLNWERPSGGVGNSDFRGIRIYDPRLVHRGRAIKTFLPHRIRPPAPLDPLPQTKLRHPDLSFIKLNATLHVTLCNSCNRCCHIRICGTKDVRKTDDGYVFEKICSGAAPITRAISKLKSQGSAPSSPETLQSKNYP
jgi:hypothetical protein